MSGQLTTKIDVPKNQIDLINLIFAELEITYHNQFHKAFPHEESIKLAKQLWLAKLEGFENQIVFKAIDEIIETSKYLPSLSDVLSKTKEVRNKTNNIPSSVDAYKEATSLGEKNPSDYKWSHPFIYHVGCEVGWYRLKTESEKFIKDAFIQTYNEMAESLSKDSPFLQLPKKEKLLKNSNALSKKEKLKELEKLKKKFL